MGNRRVEERSNESMSKLGKREREARKRHRRASYWNSSWGTGSKSLKLGHKHIQRCLRQVLVADPGKR